MNVLYVRYLHDLSFGLHAECLYFPRPRCKRLSRHESRKTRTADHPRNALRQIQGTDHRRPAGPYLNWFAREGFPHGELGGLLALMQEIDHNGLSELLEPLRAKHGKPAPRH